MRTLFLNGSYMFWHQKLTEDGQIIIITYRSCVEDSTHKLLKSASVGVM